MTPAELRRLADKKTIEANSLLRSADRLHSQARSLQGLLDPLVAVSQRVWVGPAARDFEETSRLHARRVNDQADSVQRIATEMGGQARRLMREADALRAQARAADSVSIVAPGVPAGVI